MTLHENRHYQFFGRPPTLEQSRLYTAVPKKKGYKLAPNLTEKQEVELFEAVFTVGLSFCVTDAKPTYVFVPAWLERWAQGQVGRIAAEIMQGCKKQKQTLLSIGRTEEAELVNVKARRLGELFQSIRMGSRLSRQTVQPDFWTAYGFDDTSDVPGWLIENLLPTYSFQRDD